MHLDQTHCCCHYHLRATPPCHSHPPELPPAALPPGGPCVGWGCPKLAHTQLHRNLIRSIAAAVTTSPNTHTATHLCCHQQLCHPCVGWGCLQIAHTPHQHRQALGGQLPRLHSTAQHSMAQHSMVCQGRSHIDRGTTAQHGSGTALHTLFLAMTTCRTAKQHQQHSLG
jgi:hypothetical protein